MSYAVVRQASSSTVRRRVRRALGATATAIDSIPSNLGVIQAKSGWTYQLTPDDLLWLARSVQAEGGSRPDATIWTLAQDFALKHGTSFTSLIRSYSQPVNPEWSDPSTSKCQAYPSDCTAAKVAHRLTVQSMPWTSISASIRGMVIAFAQAALPNPVPGAVEFADASVSQSYVSSHAGARIVLAANGNDYIVTADTSLWANDQVTVSFQGGTSGVASFPVGLVVGVSALVLGAGFAVWAWRRRRAQYS